MVILPIQKHTSAPAWTCSRVIGHLAFPGTIPTFWLTAESYKRSDWLLFIKAHYDL
jgi:hypothetical protein